MHAHCILPNCPESPIGNWENIRHAPQRAAQPALVSMCVPHTIRVYSCLVLSLHTLLVISAAAKCHRSKYRCGEFHIFLLANSRRNGKYIGRPIIADTTGQGGNPARDASRSRRIFPMDSPQSRASLRVIKLSSKLNRQPHSKIRSGKIAKADKNNYSNG
jgi:hypothetical protein